jgi:hypothetical protein
MGVLKVKVEKKSIKSKYIFLLNLYTNLIQRCNYYWGIKQLKKGLEDLRFPQHLFTCTKFFSF